MKRSLSRAEWWLLLAPIAGMLSFAIWLTAHRLSAPAFESAPDTLTRVMWSCDGRSIYGIARSKRQDNFLWLQWDVASGELRRTQQITGSNNSLNLSPDERLAIVSARNGERLIKMPEGTARWEVPFGNALDLEWTPRNELIRLAGRGKNEILEQMDVQTGAVKSRRGLSNLFASGQGVGRLVFSPDGKQVVLVENISSFSQPIQGQTSRGTWMETGGRVIVASWPDLKPLMKIPIELAGRIEFGRNGKVVRIVSHIKDGSSVLATLVAQSDIATRKTRWTTIEDAGAYASSCVLAREGQLLITSSTEVGFSVYSTRTGQKLGQFGAIRGYKGFGEPFMAAVSPDGNRLLRPNGRDIELFDLKSYTP